MKNFDASLALVLRFEGGYVDNKFDPGGATNMGITLATLAQHRGGAVSKIDVQNLARSEAAEIYRQNYWAAIHADQLPSGVDMFLFDFAVNSGCVRAIKALQSVLNLKTDGIFRADMLAALNKCQAADVVKALAANRQSFLEQLHTFRVFGRGWLARVEAVKAEALKLTCLNSH